MKRRYTTRPRGWEQYVDYPRDEVRDGEALVVYDGDDRPMDTGLLDASGEKIFVTASPNIGFLKDEL